MQPDESAAGAENPSVTHRNAAHRWRWLVPEWVNRNFAIVLVARALMSACRALVAVVAPVYLAIEGFGALRLGILFLVIALAAAVMSALIGTASDRVGRKPFLVAVPLLAGAAGAVFATTRSVPILFVAAALGTFGRGSGAGAGAVGPYQPAEAALVTDGVAAVRRNAAFGRLAFVSSLGALTGGLLALLVHARHPSAQAAMAIFRPAFVAAAILATAAGLVALAIREPGGRMAGARPGDRPGRRLRLPRRSRHLLHRLWATNTLNGLAVGMFGPFVSYWLFRRFGASVAEIGVLFAVVNVAAIPSTLSAAPIARRFGLVRTVVSVRAAQAVLLVPLALSPTFAVAGAFYLVRMVIQRVGMPLRQSYVLAMADSEERGAVAALANLPSQMAMAASPALSGYLFDEVSLTLPFEIAAVLQAANALLYWVFFRKLPPEEEAPAAADRSGAR